MSNLGSQKRKQRTSERANLPEAEAILDTVLHEDFDLAEHTKSIRSGTHSEFLKRKEALVFEMEKKIAIADRYRKLQIKNINDLYDFELEEIKSRFQVWFILIYLLMQISLVMILFFPLHAECFQ